MSNTSTLFSSPERLQQRTRSSGSAGEHRAGRVLMLAFNFPPAATAGVHRTLRFVKYLDQFGWHPTVLTRHCGVESGGDKLLAQVPTKVTVHRVGRSHEPPPDQTSRPESRASKPRRPGGRLAEALKNLLRPGWELATETPDQYVGWSRQVATRAIELIRDGGFDAIYTTGPPHSTHLAGLRIHRKTGLPWVADFRDPWARRPWSKSRNPWGQRLLPAMERRVARHATCVVLNNDASLKDFCTAYPELPADKFIAIPNGYDPDLVSAVERLREQRQNNPRTERGAPRIPVLCHPGTLYGQRDPRPILEAIARLHRKGTDVRFQQIGFVSPKFDPKAIATDLGIGHLVETLPQVSHHEALTRMSQADVLLVIQPNGPLMVPGKLYEMLLFDLPIIAVCDSVATTEVVHSAGRTSTAGSADPDAIQAAILDCLRMVDNDLQLSLREEARGFYDGRLLTKRLADRLTSVLLNR